MKGLELWLTLLLLALTAFALRYVPMALLERLEMPEWLERALRYVPAATLAGLVFPTLLLQQNQLVLLGNDRLLAGLLAAVVAWRTRNVLLTFAVGLGVLWLLRLV